MCQMVSLNAAGVVLSARVDQLQKDLDALKADARAKEKTWTGVERRNVSPHACVCVLLTMMRESVLAEVFYVLFYYTYFNICGDCEDFPRPPIVIQRMARRWGT